MVGLKLRGVTKSFGAMEVIRDVDLEVPEGSFCAFVGPSGCGKSTLLRMIAGLEDVSGGSIQIGDRDVTWEEPSKRGIAMVFQSYALYPHLTVRQNIGFGLSLAKLPKAEITEKVDEAAALLQLTPLLDRKPKALSGGQRQRVAIGRAIVRNPKVFLFDEPLSNLDASLRAQMRMELAELHDRIGATMIYVTHDQVEAMTMADQIVVLNGGKVEQAGPPMDLYRAPDTPFVAGFIGSPRMNLWTGAVASGFGCSTFGVRPEHVSLSRESGLWPAAVKFIERLGSDALVHLDSGELGRFVARTHGETDLAPGDQIFATPQDGYEHRFTE